MRRLVILCSIATLLFTSIQANQWHGRKAEGWAWYEDRQRQEKEASQAEVQMSTPSATEEMNAIREVIDEKRCRAVLDPTEENVLEYVREQKKWVDQSAEFSKAWARLLLSDPYLDPTVTDGPTSQYGLRLHRQEKAEARARMIANLSQEYGLFFFYKGEDRASQATASIVQLFSKRYGWEVLAISLDGGVLPGFDDNEVDNGVAKALGIEMTPALVAVNPTTEELVPIAFGLVTLDRIEENIALQFADHLEESNENL